MMSDAADSTKRLLLYGISRVGNWMEQSTDWWWTRAGGREGLGVAAKRVQRVSIWGDEHLLELDCETPLKCLL